MHRRQRRSRDRRDRRRRDVRDHGGADRRAQRPVRERSGRGHRQGFWCRIASFSNSTVRASAFLDLPQGAGRLRRSPMPAADRREGADLVVVGASVGGLTAAITAADRGCQVDPRRAHEGPRAAAPPPPDEAVVGRRDSLAARGRGRRRSRAPRRRPARERRRDRGRGAGRARWRRRARRSSSGSPTAAAPTIQLPRSGGRGPRRRPACMPCAEHGGREPGRGARARRRPSPSHPAARRHRGDPAAARRRRRHRRRRQAGSARRPDASPGGCCSPAAGSSRDDELIAEHCPAATGLAGAAARRWRRATACASRRAPARADARPRAVRGDGALRPPGAARGSGRRCFAQGAILVNQAGRRFADERPGPAGARASRCVRSPGTWPTSSSTIASRQPRPAPIPFVEHVVLPRAGRRGGTPLDLAKQLELDARRARRRRVAGGPLEAAAARRPRHRARGCARWAGWWSTPHARVLDAERTAGSWALRDGRRGGGAGVAARAGSRR